MDRDAKNAYGHLLHTCLAVDSKRNEAFYLKPREDLAESSQEIKKKINAFKERLSKEPLIAFILLWANSINSADDFNSVHIAMMNDLIEKKVIFSKNSKENTPLTLSYLLERNKFLIESVRCHKEWSFEKRENYVSFYINFTSWLSKVTFGYIPEVFDLDRSLTAGRLLKFETYIKIVNNLLLRDRIIAKICYLGGSRPTEDVFSLKIQDINFSHNILKLGEKFVNYPSHLFEDLKEYISSRKKGPVFANRAGVQVDNTVPYRALKTVINKLDLDKSFTFKDFMKSA